MGNRFSSLPAQGSDPLSGQSSRESVPALYIHADGIKAAEKMLRDISVKVKGCKLGSGGHGKVRFVASSMAEREQIHETLTKMKIGHLKPQQRSERPFKCELRGFAYFCGVLNRSTLT